MKKLTVFFIIALFAGISVAGVKNVAVVEMEIDMEPYAKAKLKKSEVRLITDELRNTAVKNLPRGRYNVMTTETVMSQSGSVLAECAEENCVITLGSKIGADYIVRGKIGKIETLFTLSVSIFDTEDGFLVGSMDAVRSEKLIDLLEKSTAACTEMYKEFANMFEKTQNEKTQDQVRKPAAKGLDLDKLLVDDEEGDLLTEEESAVPKTVSDSAALSQTPVNADGQPAGVDESVKAADSAGGAPNLRAGRRGPPSPGTAKSDTAVPGPAVVEEGRTINFAQNLKEYRSPRLAMLLSLLVPGLGQAYSRSYIKASAFGAAEVAAIGVAVYLNSVAKSKKKEAYSFADEHFDVDSIRLYDSRLREKFVERDSAIVKDSLTQLPYDKYFFDMAGSKGAYYYESIRGKSFTPGWKDNVLSLDQLLDSGPNDTIVGSDGSRYILDNYTNDDAFYYVKKIFDNAGRLVSNGESVLGYSSYQTEYNTKMDRSNSYRDAVNYVFYAIILNHIASAIDAGFTARAYNARLLGEDNSAWNRLSVEQQFVFTGFGHSPGVALRLRF
ncbi:MAG: hypothetical protein LBB74_10295 [Chitinispirillales bacterium]|nr:hypothetical protein [Chitinispirillales bacterium]